MLADVTHFIILFLVIFHLPSICAHIPLLTGHCFDLMQYNLQE